MFIKSSDFSYRLFQTLSPSTSIDNIVLQTELPPLLPSEILEKNTIPTEKRTEKDNVDALSVALLAVIGSDCFLAQYPVQSSQKDASEFGVWCKGEKYPQGIEVKDGVLIAQHPDALYPSMAPKDVEIWEKTDAIDYAYGKKVTSRTLDPQKSPSPKTGDTGLDESVPEETKTTNMQISDEMVIAGVFSFLFSSFWLYRRFKKKRRQEKVKEMKVREQEESF